MGLHLTTRPLDFLLFSDFSVLVAYVHLCTPLMIGPIATRRGAAKPRVENNDAVQSYVAQSEARWRSASHQPGVGRARYRT